MLYTGTLATAPGALTSGLSPGAGSAANVPNHLPARAPRASVKDVPKTRPSGDVDIAPYVSAIAARLHDRLAPMSSAIRVSLEQQIPELRGDARAWELLGPSVEGNVDTLLHALQYAIPVQRVEAPTAALEYARRLAQHGVPVNALVRAYRLGQNQVNELVFAEVRETDMPEPSRYAVLEMISKTLFDYIDRMTQQVVGVYEDERERWLENQHSLRALRVREVLDALTSVDVDATTTTIRYPLRWHHLAVVMWCPDVGTEGSELSRLQAFLRDLGRAADAAAVPLFVAADRTCAWGWLPYREAAPNAEQIVHRFALGRPNAPSVAIGAMASGLEGFRRSHRDAQGARRVAQLGGRTEPLVIAANEPGLTIAALLGEDIADTRAWVATVLGDLACEDDNDERLRETLRIYLGCGASYKLAAEILCLHFNTVKYRIGRAVARRGREIDSDRLGVELALTLCHWYGAAVLKPSHA
jgi:DNA-binding PucR family transcriptional regulator